MCAGGNSGSSPATFQWSSPLKGCEIHEIKRSRWIEKAHEYQLWYYLYYLKRLGVEGKGVLNYPLLRKNVEVDLDAKKEADIGRIQNTIYIDTLQLLFL